MVREVLLREWDPIGIEAIPGADDEYDAYIGTVCVMLADEAATKQVLATYLLSVATERMGMEPSPDLAHRCDCAAGALAAMRPRLTLH
jgi:hypothetical protein